MLLGNPLQYMKTNANITIDNEFISEISKLFLIENELLFANKRMKKIKLIFYNHQKVV